ncbi:hypothetical protein ACOSQ2_007098 [Xanthoceras sorbifolium]
MGTQNETNAEFRNEVHEILGRHESSIEEVHATLQTAEQYFDFKEVVAEQQVQLALFHLERIALQWHRWFAKLKGPVTWIEFTKALLLRFGPTDYEDPSEALTRLKQTTTVSAYEEEFEKLSHRVNELPENFLVGSFIAGLKNDIRLDVKIKQPRSLTDAIGVARFIEERNRLQKKRISAFRFLCVTGHYVLTCIGGAMAHHFGTNRDRLQEADNDLSRRRHYTHFKRHEADKVISS